MQILLDPGPPCIRDSSPTLASGELSAEREERTSSASAMRQRIQEAAHRERTYRYWNSVLFYGLWCGKGLGNYMWMLSS
jgi:hypothetical protein